AAQVNTADSASVSEGLPEDLIGDVGDSIPANDSASLVGKGTQENVPKDSGSDTIPNAAAPDDALTGDDLTDDSDTEKTESKALVGQSARVSLTPGGYPSRFDLCDLGRVTPVKVQDPWGTCWAFAATAAAETSILSKMGSTYAETGLDLSERYLAWYVAQPVTEDISSSQAGEGLHLYDENPNAIYKFGGAGYCAGTLYAQGIGPVPESEYPYRGIEGKLSYETLVADKDAVIGAILQEYKQSYPYISEDELRPYAEQYYEAYLAMYETYDTYSEYDDWTISEADEPGAGRLRGTPYTLIDNNVFIYWITDTYDGVDKFDKEPIAGGPIGSGDKHLYQDSIDQLKSELYAGRGVSVCIKTNDDALNKETWAYYFDGKATSDRHAVCIVGWDDDYPASNFTKEPPGNGAWIAKNSWGSQTDIIPGGLVAADGTTKDANGGDWGIVDENGLHTGYFYLSYYDAGINSPESFDFDLRENHDQENALQLDYMPAAASEWIHKDKNPVWCANVFTLDKDMRIDEVATRFATGFEVPLTGFTITFDIYRLRDGATAPEDGELLASCTREVSSSGYHRVALDNPVYSKAGDRLAVVVSHRHDYEDGSAKYFATSQISLSYRENPAWRRDPVYGTPVINEGESFLKIENVTDHDEYAAEGWLDLCAPFSRDFFIYMNPTVASSEDMLEWYASRYIGTPIKNSYHYDNFGIKAFGEVVTLEFVEAVAAACEKAGSLEYWRDPLTNAIFADGYGTKPLTWEEITVNPLGHAWGDPTYTWAGDNSSVTARSICQRDNDHVLAETVNTVSNTKAGMITWTAQFENGIFTTQTRSAYTEPVPGVPDEKTPKSQSKDDDSEVRTCTVKKVYAAPADKTSDSTVIHAAPVPTGDDTDAGLWYTLLAGALACIVTLLAKHRGSRRSTICK
ncbi:MAG: C1 family peptidase, partial [Lachnospiraceae bacterium]